jgi:hypothetical protein
MVPHLRRAFNEGFTPENHRRLLRRLDALAGHRIDFKVCETPLFIPAPLMNTMIEAGEAIVRSLADNEEYGRLSARMIPEEFRAPGEDARPLFVAVDFGLVYGEDGAVVPRVVELQGFPTLFAFQAVITQAYKEVHGLPASLSPFPPGVDLEGYYALLRRAVLGERDPEEVVLLELDPEKQKTRCDFVMTEHICGIRTVNIRDVVKEGRSLFHRSGGRLVPIRRIYNRAITDEIASAGVVLPFSFRDELDVEWAGHPNWFFRLSKYSLPFIRHAAVPRTVFLSEMEEVPQDLSRWVLKPLFSFAGSGVKVGPSRADVDAVPASRRHEYVLQERVEYAPVVETPHGGTRAEVRIMYFWLDRLMPVGNLVRLGRGEMMGVRFNAGLEWVGSSAGLVDCEGTESRR